MPVAGGDLGQKRKKSVAEIAHFGNSVVCLPGNQAVALGIVNTPPSYRVEQGRQIVRIHLAVAVHLDGHIETVVPRPFQAGGHCPAHPLIGPMANQFDVAFFSPDPFDDRRGVVPTGIVYDHHPIHEIGHAPDHPTDLAGLVVGRHHHANRFVFVHDGKYRLPSLDNDQ